MISLFLLIDIILNMFFSTSITLSYIICISYFIKYKFKKYYYIILVIGLLYDLIFTDLLFLNSLLFFIISLLVRKYKKINPFILGFISIISYFGVNYLILVRNHIYNLDYIYFIKYITINYSLFLMTYFITKRIYNTR